MRRGILAALICLSGSYASAQTTYTADVIRDLPSGHNVFALLEGAQPEITTDQFNSGGLNAGTHELMSAFLASWTQTLYRVGDLSISSPIDGRPMLFPEVAWFDGVDASMWHTGVDAMGAGLTVAMHPLPDVDRWSGSLEATASGGSLAQDSPAKRPPAITELDDAASITGVVRGAAMNGRLHLMFGGASNGATTTVRGAQRSDQHTGSFFTRAAWQLSSERTAQMLAWVQPGDAVHAQLSLASGERWRLFGGLTAAGREPREDMTIERLLDGPVSVRAAAVDSHERLWTIGARGARRYGSRHAVMYGLVFDRGSMRSTAFSGVIHESVNGIPARAWSYFAPSSESRRHALTGDLFLQDRLTITDRLAADLGLRVSSAHGRAQDAARGIGWNTLEPSAAFHWNIGTPLHLDTFIGVSRVADRLRLNTLAAGDPHAEAAEVFRWNGSTIGPLVARTGPGTGGSDTFSTIDPKLRRPVTDEATLGLASQLFAPLRLHLTLIARRQRPMVNLVNVGVPVSGYTVLTINDPNGDLVKPDDDQLLPVYDRKPESFGRDSYLLTNPDMDAADTGALIVGGEWKSEHVLISAGGTAQFSVAPGVNRGNKAVENDQTLLGEAFSDPNAATYMRGQLFNDRAYTIKVMSVVALPRAITAGVIARYQDGQPFSRVQIVPGLNQGPEVIQAFGRGRSRFTYRSTLDLRLRKQVTVDKVPIDLLFDTYNLLNMSNEVEEYVVTGPRFRETTAVQPPRSFHLGLRFLF